MILLLGLLWAASCAANGGAPRELRDRHAVRVVGEDSSDLAFLRDVLAGKRVVLLGESSHGIGDFYSFKARLVRFLHEELGFGVLAMEAGSADVYLQWRAKKPASARALRDAAVFANYRCAEVMPLFEHLVAERDAARPLEFVGFDAQNYISFDAELERMLTESVGAAKAEQIASGLRGVAGIMPLVYGEDRAALDARVQSIREASAAAAELLESQRSALQRDFGLTELGLTVCQRAARDFGSLVDVDWERESIIAKRDEVMARTLFWWMDEVYPEERFVVWAHNAHIGKVSTAGDGNKWLGQYVRERYGDKSYALGLFARSGESYVWFKKETMSFEHDDPSAVESLAYSRGDAASFVDLTRPGVAKREPWTVAPVTGFELENGGERSFVPSERFDGVVVLGRVKAPSYERRGRD